MAKAKHNIMAELEPLVVAIDRVVPFPGNPRRGDIELIRESLRLTGQYKPILVQASTNYIMAGNQTWHAAKLEGWSKIAAQFLDVDEATAKRILLVDNRANEKGEYDHAELLALLEEQTDLMGTGYDLDALEDIRAQIAQLAWVPPTWNGGEPTGYGRAGSSGGEDDEEPPAWVRPEGSRAGMMREMVLLLSVEESDEMRDSLAALMREYGTSTVKDTIVEAIRREARELS